MTISCSKSISCNDIISSLQLQNLAIYPSSYTVDSSHTMLHWANVNFQVIGVNRKRVWNFNGSGLTIDNSSSPIITVTYSIPRNFDISFEGNVSGTVQMSIFETSLNAFLITKYESTLTKTDITIVLTFDFSKLKMEQGTSDDIRNKKEWSYDIFIKDSGFSCSDCGPCNQPSFGPSENNNELSCGTNFSIVNCATTGQITIGGIGSSAWYLNSSSYGAGAYWTQGYGGSEWTLTKGYNGSPNYIVSQDQNNQTICLQFVAGSSCSYYAQCSGAPDGGFPCETCTVCSNANYSQ